MSEQQNVEKVEPTQTPLLADAWPIEDARDAADAALGVVRDCLGLSDAAQDAQDGAGTASEVGGGSECHSDAARPGESRRESENER